MPIKINKAIEERIVDLLTKYPKLRDSDDRLVANMWAEDMGGLQATKAITLESFLRQYALGELTMAESITRIRRKIQAEKPELRGETYKLRDAHELKIEKDLGYHNPTKEPYPKGEGYHP